ncbi:MAG: MarR family transcriptional regulator [Myxococcales bacterium]|nr:MarR family transcriptional regulator [Polyangiaceae bacterium]MDW8247922.1 MarR family transcriptional regulator [Myxococcales bacterium]
MSRSLGPSIVVRVLTTSNLLLSELRRGLGPELTLARFDLLMQLLREDGQTSAELSRRMLVTAGNLTGLVDRAERDGLVERRRDPDDRRQTRVHLTGRGARLARRAMARHHRLADELVSPLDRKDQETLRRLLWQLREAIEHHATQQEDAP